MTLVLNPPQNPVEIGCPWTIRAETRADGPEVDRLVSDAFGPGRYVKAVERLREGDVAASSSSRVAARPNSRGLAGCVRLWPLVVGDEEGLLLGPIAVDPAFRGQGLGAALVLAAVEAARGAEGTFVVLVGDEPFFGPLGFSRHLAANIALPGPVDPDRMMALRLSGPVGAPLAGVVRRA